MRDEATSLRLPAAAAAEGYFRGEYYCDYLDTLFQAGHRVGLPPEYLARLHARRPQA